MSEKRTQNPFFKKLPSFPPRLLHIYDADSLFIDLTASIRRNKLWGRPNVYNVPIHDGELGLRTALDKLVKTSQQFGLALFETHASSGAISFGKDSITGHVLRTYAGRGYERIFPYYFSRIYFNGCNVADSPDVWDFLDAAGGLFLRLGGGVAFAQTGAGHPILLTGHVYHFGSTAYSTWAPGGVFTGHKVED
jgi:hypothetical protein